MCCCQARALLGVGEHMLLPRRECALRARRLWCAPRAPSTWLGCFLADGGLTRQGGRTAKTVFDSLTTEFIALCCVLPLRCEHGQFLCLCCCCGKGVADGSTPMASSEPLLSAHGIVVPAMVSACGLAPSFGSGLARRRSKLEGKLPHQPTVLACGQTPRELAIGDRAQHAGSQQPPEMCICRDVLAGRGLGCNGATRHLHEPRISPCFCGDSFGSRRVLAQMRRM